MANSVDPDQTAPIGAVCSGSTLFASILNLSEMLGNYLQQTTFSNAFFSWRFKSEDSLPTGKFFHAFLSSADFFFKSIFLKNSFRNTIRVSNRSGSKLFAMLSADDTRR